MVTELLMLAGIRTRVLGRAEQSGALPQPVSPAAEILFLTALKNLTALRRHRSAPQGAPSLV